MPPTLASLPRTAWILIGIAFTLAWFANLDGRRLQHPDEGRYAEIAREMVATGDWTTPRLNGLKYFEKPALQYWLTAASLAAFGDREGAVRLVPALAGWLAVVAVGWAGWRIASPAVGLYAALVLGGSFWHIGISHIVTLDALLSSLLGVALAAFLVAQRDGATPGETRAWMLLAWAAIAGAALTKGPVALLIPGATLVLYSLLCRDFALWRRLHLVPGVLLFVVLTAPWFVVVSRANPEFARFFFIHEHVERFLSPGHRRTGAWWYFVPLLAAGLLPWLGIWLATLRASWRDGGVGAHGFAWPRFCLVWAGFVFLFFSVSSSKLPSYILPMFPALALPLGAVLARRDGRTLFRLSLPLALATAALGLATLVGYDALAARLADTLTPRPIYDALKPWLLAAFAVWTAGGVGALVLFRRGDEAGKSAGLAVMAVATLVGLQLGFEGSDAFRAIRSTADLAQALRDDRGAPFDPSAPVFQVRTYDQTLPFYLRRTTTLVDYRDELSLGLDAEPALGIARVDDWLARWRDLPQGYALMTPETHATLARDGAPLREVARDPRHVLVARR